MSWNPALNLIKEIKSQIPNPTYNQVGSKTSLEQWVDELASDSYQEILDYLHLSQYGDLLLLTYKDSAAYIPGIWEMHDGLFTECRSVVINLRTEELALTPFKKFRNVNECEELSLDSIKEKVYNAKRIEFSNKLDGSMQSARWYQGDILLAGRMSADPLRSWRVDDGYRMIRENKNYAKALVSNPDLTFIFEYISLKDPHIVRYTEEQEGLYLVGLRNTITGEELPYEDVINMARKYQLLSTETYKINLDDALNSLSVKKCFEAEGYVINIDGLKVKLKYDDYVLMNKTIKQLTSPNAIIKSIDEGKFDDLCAKLPFQFRAQVYDVEKQVSLYLRLREQICKKYYDLAPKNDKKETMIWITEHVPQNEQGFVKALYYNQPLELLKIRYNYIKYNDILTYLDYIKQTPFTTQLLLNAATQEYYPTHMVDKLSESLSNRKIQKSEVELC